MLGQDEQVLAVMQEHESNAMKALKTSISHIAVSCKMNLNS